MPTRLSGPQEQQLHEALIDAFPTTPELAQMVRFGDVARNLAAIAGGSNLSEIVFNLLVWAGSRDQVDALLIAARNANPTNAPLRALAETIGLAAQTPAQGELEALVLQSVGFQHVEQWRETMSKRELSICRVEIPEISYGTGFLVGPDLLMTNYHVLEAAINQSTLAGSVGFRFDFKMAADGTTLQMGELYRLATATAWLLDSSPPGQLDYALVRVAGMPGNQAVAGQQGAPQRGWLTPHAHPFTQGEPLLILQHPQLRPLALALGAVTAIAADGCAVAYSANTLPGSSGSPCFNTDWALVALHHTGNVSGNLGSRFSAILDQPLIQAALNGN
jgi:hypothetical protein